MGFGSPSVSLLLSLKQLHMVYSVEILWGSEVYTAYMPAALYF